MRLVRKVSRKQYFGKATYVHERIFIPIPAKYRDLVKPFLDRELDVSVEAEKGDLIVRVRPIDAETSKAS